MKILLVDDEPDIRKIAQLSLTAVGNHHAVVAGTATEAIATALAERPDVIILDVMMPDTDGPATLIELRKHEALSAIPVVFMTAKAQRGEIARYLALGAIGVITKPFDPMTLAIELERLVDAARRREE
ncbi:MAG: response regulator [Kofleriaceae bacterium]